MTEKKWLSFDQGLQLLAEKWFSMPRIGLAMGVSLIGYAVSPLPKEWLGFWGGLLVGFFLLPPKKISHE